MTKVECNRVINGILLVNKPQGLSSNAVLQQVRRLYRAKKAGHTGSLDPLATGMLPICFGEATKFCQYLLDADKCYEATGVLGVKTNTGDVLGEVIKTTPPFTLNESDLLIALKQFKGTIKQVPSMFSALKHKGTPLYKYAREGITIERPAREITVHELELIAFSGNQFEIKVSCSKGTYIRNLVEDIGDLLGVGAHVTKLHRLSTAGFGNAKMYTLDELQQKSPEELVDCLLPMERAVSYLPRLDLGNDEISALRQGKALDWIGKNEASGCVRLYNNNCFIGLGELNAGNLSVKRLLAF
ncbi:tRNA pseudouridine(55) synthase TruB [Legionella micdadei]|uniref:tRNA pseudouridine synthase B n=1 Tax=Legionella micdadei TaxID=451 RepID=A0A098GCB9_LEGMI|nr:tRNA pseudouridine(55) synthase TruB [Legionella micdadei]ARG96410.1 tRNA pseudouridine synthase B [Legionella micdadei]ARG99159.1 tRNA pseudouridine synthase B [Legionella micdadei]KTD29503.1 tRNA pseudouridine synthase B [Legionella micdadei]NSL18099.1 tRNA pseudouridine(55) synthase TruB [Legionella micdadei]CEG59615.1 tRNA pseudouridine synthase B [Legionella micdadei]